LPTILEEVKETMKNYGFSWFHLPYSKKEEESI
jgi:hypothetical protein